MTELVALSSPSFLSPPFSRHRFSTHVLSGSGVNEKYAVDPCSMSVDDGKYLVEWWDTYSGSILDKKMITAREGELKLNVLPVSTDIACKIFPTRL